MRILIADDDRLSTYVLQAALTMHGYSVTVARDGNEAWQILQSDDPPRLAVLDWMMPGMDGLEVCRKIRSAGGPYIYVLLLTANVDPAEVVAGIDAGADDYITKPFNPDELHARLRTGQRIVELEERLRLQATMDYLTGVLNRAAIMEGLERELPRSVRENVPLSVAMVDLDHFKKINDNHGHTAGDAVLREAAARMRAMLRPYDLIGRFGGEEFTIVFPRCEVSQAASIAERLRAFLAAEPIETGSCLVSVTASIGVSDTSRFTDAHSLIRAADAALFRAKSSGRNRVESTIPQLAKGATAR